MFDQESLLPGISNQLALAAIAIAIALYALYRVSLPCLATPLMLRLSSSPPQQISHTSKAYPKSPVLCQLPATSLNSAMTMQRYVNLGGGSIIPASFRSALATLELWW
jgi:hypothetical protein